MTTIPVLHGDPDSFDALVFEPRSELVVVYFWGPDCPNCDFFASRLPALLEQLGPVPARLVKVNAYAHESLATRFGLYGIPQFLLYRDGKRIGKMSEFRGDAFFLGVLREQLPPRAV